MTISLYETCRGLLDKPNITEVLITAQVQVTLAKQTALALKNGRLTSFDPIVGENTCQWRAIHAIESSLDQELIQEAERVYETACSLLTKLVKLRNKPQLITHSGSTEELLAHLELDIPISEKLHYSTLSYFLTCGKFFQMRRDGHERSGIDLNRIRSHLCPSADSSWIGKLESVSRERIAALTIKLIQHHASNLGEEMSLPLSDRYIRKIFTSSRLMLQTSSAFHNFKATFLTLERLGIPVVLTEHGTNEVLLVCGGTLNQLGAKAPLFQIEVFSNKEIDLEKEVRQRGLPEIALACIAVLPQYSEDDNISALSEEAQKEILHYRELGHTLGCLTDKPAILKIAHTHATTKQELLKK